jgi:hypothetical protein
MRTIKDRFAIILAMFMIVANSIKSQNSKSKYDFSNMQANVPNYYLKGSTELKKFPTEAVLQVNSGKKLSLRIKGANSSLKIKSSDELTIICKQLDDISKDQTSGLSICKLEVKKNKREVLYSILDKKTYKAELSKDVLMFPIEKLESKIFKLVFDKKLEAGEYMIFMPPIGYTFSIE